MVDRRGSRGRSRAAALVVALATLLGLLVGAAPARAGGPTVHTYTGTDPTDGSDWQRAKNWDDETVPDNGDAVIINKDVTVYNIPNDKVFSAVFVSKGARLTSRDKSNPDGPLSTGALWVDCGYLDTIKVAPLLSMVVTGSIFSDIDVTVPVTGELVVRPPIPLVETGCEDPGNPNLEPMKGRLVLQFGSTVSVSGRVHGNGGRIVGGTSEPSLTLLPTGRLGLAAERLILESLTSELGGVIDSTGVVIAGEGREVALRGRGTVDVDRLRLLDNARLTLLGSADDEAGVANYVATGSISLAPTAELSVAEGSSVRGTPTFTGGGTLTISGSTISGAATRPPPEIVGTVTVAADTRLKITGNGDKRVVPLDAAVPSRAGVLIAKGPVTLLKRGRVLVGGRVEFRSGATVPTTSGIGTTVEGTGCCSEPIPELVLRGTSSIGAFLKVRNMRLRASGPITGVGQLILDGGRHVLVPGAALKLRRTSVAAALDLPSGSMVLDGRLEMGPGATVSSPRSGCAPSSRQGPWCPSTVSGSGSLAWEGGDLRGAISFGRGIEATATASFSRAITDPASRVALLGPLTSMSHIRLESGSTLTLGGAARLENASFDATSCCSQRPSLVIGPGGVATVAPGFVTAANELRLVVQGTLAVSRSRLRLADSDLVVAAGGLLRLGGGKVVGDGRVIRTAAGSRLLGPGSVGGPLVVGGSLALGTRGVVDVRGRLTLGATASTTVVIGGSEALSDRVSATGPVVVGGRLTAVVPRPTRARLAIVSGSERAGRFSAVAGLGSHALVYDEQHVWWR